MYSETTNYNATKITCTTHRNPTYTITKVTATDVEGNSHEYRIFHEDDMTVKVETSEFKDGVEILK
jgi:hypothetical protein